MQNTQFTLRMEITPMLELYVQDKISNHYRSLIRFFFSVLFIIEEN